METKTIDVCMEKDISPEMVRAGVEVLRLSDLDLMFGDGSTYPKVVAAIFAEMMKAKYRSAGDSGPT